MGFNMKEIVGDLLDVPEEELPDELRALVKEWRPLLEAGVTSPSGSTPVGGWPDGKVPDGMNAGEPDDG